MPATVAEATDAGRATPAGDDARDDADLVVQALAGSRQAVSELISRHQRLVRMYVARAIYDRHAADDVAQDVFVSAVQNLARFRGEGPLGAWLLGIARRKVLLHLRGQARRLRREEAYFDALYAWWTAERLGAADEPDAEAELHLQRRLERCLESLPPQSRSAIDSYYFHRQSADEIGRRLNRSPAAVRMLLMRIRSVLRKCLNAQAQTEVPE